MGGEKKFDEGTLGPSLATCNDHKWPAGIGESLSVSIGYSIFRLSSSYSIFNIHHQTFIINGSCLVISLRCYSCFPINVYYRKNNWNTIQKLWSVTVQCTSPSSGITWMKAEISMVWGYILMLVWRLINSQWSIGIKNEGFLGTDRSGGSRRASLGLVWSCTCGDLTWLTGFEGLLCSP